MHRLSSVLLAGAGLVAAALPVLGGSSAANAASAIDETRTVTTKQPIVYDCDYTIRSGDQGTLPLGLLPTTIEATFDVPARLYPGQVVPPTPVAVDVAPFELNGAARVLLDARTAEGYSDDAQLEITTAEGQSSLVPLGRLAAPREEIAELGEKWVIPAAGTSPAITVPSTSRIRLSAPETFSLSATLYKEDGSEAASADVPCTYAPVSSVMKKQPSRTIAYLKVSKLYPKLTTKAVPTDVVANRTRPTITVKAYSQATPTGAVEVREGSKVLATGTLKNGSAAVQLPVFGKKGTRNLTVAYAGDVSNNAATSTTSLTVR